jgi:hypothetical protein
MNVTKVFGGDAKNIDENKNSFKKIEKHLFILLVGDQQRRQY